MGSVEFDTRHHYLTQSNWEELYERWEEEAKIDLTTELIAEAWHGDRRHQLVISLIRDFLENNDLGRAMLEVRIKEMDEYQRNR